MTSTVALCHQSISPAVELIGLRLWELYERSPEIRRGSLLWDGNWRCNHSSLESDWKLQPAKMTLSMSRSGNQQNDVRRGNAVTNPLWQDQLHFRVEWHLTWLRGTKTTTEHVEPARPHRKHYKQSVTCWSSFICALLFSRPTPDEPSRLALNSKQCSASTSWLLFMYGQNQTPIKNSH